MDCEWAPDEYILEAILGHEEVNGQMFFQVKWKGFEDPDLQPAGNLFQRFSNPSYTMGVSIGYKWISSSICLVVG